MAESEPKAQNCPNCQQPAIRIGDEITCEPCDAIFVITKKQGARVKQIGIDERIGRLEDEVFKEKPEPEPEPKPEPEPEVDEDEL